MLHPRSQKQPTLVGRREPVFEFLEGADFKRALKIVGEVFEPEEESPLSVGAEMIGRMPYFLGLARSRLGQDDGPIIFQKIVPFQAGASEECLFSG